MTPVGLLSGLDSPVEALHVALALGSRDTSPLGIDTIAGLKLVGEVSVAVICPFVCDDVGVTVRGLRGGGSQGKKGGDDDLMAGSRRRRSSLHGWPLASRSVCAASHSVISK